ncbi:hypothetical protein [Stutzerimonas nitrititolerans]|uniref:hypothetical protein n=1 Tax=Stutzerimonas nitrititolerans TaxID=2482751 RepID=UPI002897C30E|nr:hypothetical protein [Stutzerimonas nitrititolerans]
MSLTQFFAKIGAPLKNPRWSWGGVREDGTVILRVWQDRKIKHEGAHYMQLSHLQKYGEGQDNLGYMERLEHIKFIQSGAKCSWLCVLPKTQSALHEKFKVLTKTIYFSAASSVK